MESTDSKSDVIRSDLNARLETWKQIQHEVASRVSILPDSIFSSSLKHERYQHHRSPRLKADRLYDGVDVSFPSSDDDPAVAVYVILRGCERVYVDHEIFELSVPYVSSFLSFREIEPLVSPACSHSRTRCATISASCAT